jgi:hypothetical protein
MENRRLFADYRLGMSPAECLTNWFVPRMTLMIPIPDRWAEEDIRAQNINAPEAGSCTHSAVRSKVRPGIFFAIVLFAWCAGLVSSRAGDEAPSEAQVKAAFLLNFPKYVEWPVATFPQSNSPIAVGIMDSEEVAGEFSKMSDGRVVEGHPIKFVRVTLISQCCECQILYVGSSEARKLPEILSSVEGANVLTVGESDGFTDRGGMINLARRERRIVLEVNLDAAHKSQLKISSKLMALATVKGGRK